MLHSEMAAMMRVFMTRLYSIPFYACTSEITRPDGVDFDLESDESAMVVTDL